MRSLQLSTLCLLSLAFLISPVRATAQIKTSHGDSVGATARCGDGTYSHAKAKKGACAKHGGIAQWMGSTGTGPSADSAMASSPSGATAKCKDGTYSKSASKQGACAQHGGVAKWLQKKSD